ncbi:MULTISPECIES: hypothetical protein [unclassified Leifsonia]|uniref:hypothetical protein n=1 Tax=unclassified Leifsonia TaxID=2663824 RepID=UPI0008A7C46E|nr:MULTISPECIES: hypothetical protein [unclassified Leifsonia]SEI02351.1 hypothetical protein SAMN04515694_11063 [Leifsonia sp. CL154]SFL71140.1 hypothetical protein SAMN04515692_11063 [Leifsonia sp. CL147]
MTKVDRPEQNPEQNPQEPSRRRRRILIVVGAVVVAALLAVAISVAAVRGAQNAQARAVSTPTPFQLPTPDKNSPPPPSASPAPQSTSSSKPAAPPKVDPRYGAPVAAVVSTGTTATLAGGLTAKLHVADTTAKAVRAGEVAGPAITVQVELTNPGGTDVSLAQVAVNAYYGKTSIPATELTDGAQPLLGTLKAGETRTGVYIFSIPEGQSSSAVVTVTDAAGTPITVFK